MYSIKIDWMEELKTEKWLNNGRIAIEKNCTHHKENEEDTNMRYSGYCDQCEVSENTAHPMMNFIYPLEIEPSSDAILETVKKTNCTVMENTETGEHFLTLTGGGMDLSQDIALAYHICQNWIPFDLAVATATQKEFSLNKQDWQRMKDAVIASLKNEIVKAEEKIKSFKEEVTKK